MNFDEFKERYLKVSAGVFDITDDELIKIYCGLSVYNEYVYEEQMKQAAKHKKRVIQYGKETS